jgi:type IV pilus assembly protein PilQ
MKSVAWLLAAALALCNWAASAQPPVQGPAAIENSPAAPPIKTYRGQLVSFNFQTIEVRTLLQLLAHFSGFNIIVSDDNDRLRLGFDRK